LTTATSSPIPMRQQEMAWIPGGTFRMGSEDFYPEERPVYQVSVDGFWMDEHPVTAAQFRRFVRETCYVTVAERPLDPEQFPDADPDLLVPGSLVFRTSDGPVNLNDYRNWWEYVPGAHWRRPGGKGTTINGRDHHPVVHVAYEDAAAYAAPFRHHGQRLGVDLRLVGSTASRRGREPLLRPEQPPGDLTRPELQPRSAREQIPRRVIKGGSHLCAPNYCLRYRPAARQPQMIDTSMAHLGFRCIVRPPTSSEERLPDA
jgi:formylglycine-generating enzyme required for sulfatase activity